MNQAQIVVRDLTKTYRVPERSPGLAASLKGLVRRTWREVEAVREIGFTVEAGERVGFIGPNGAGKTTTLKMLSGLLYPTAGEARVLGYVPWQRRPDYLRRISMVLGNKSQMLWDIPPLDTFAVLGEMYHVPQAEWRRTVDELVDLLEMQDLLTRPVRNLSLGERMKCELVAGLLYRPEVLYLDEPTLALVLKPELHVQPRNALAFFPALALAGLLRFFWGYWLALLAFWATRADALLALQDALVFLLAGQVAPTVLLPGALRAASAVLPFRYMLGFPVEILMGQLSPNEVRRGFALQGLWLAVALALYVALWRRGVRRYSAVGG